ncbi:hypothetical protein ACIRRA_37745 [Nocardia sp. NPDC101769]|uniref:hypothetical protein n=1 Tax=Nocardia sp. NPDC101769 TaxID=3364333 RepID=UPI00381DD6A7
MSRESAAAGGPHVHVHLGSKTERRFDDVQHSVLARERAVHRIVDDIADAPSDMPGLTNGDVLGMHYGALWDERQ